MLGIVPQEFNLDMWSRVWDTLIINAGFQGVEKKEAEQRAEFLLKKLSLWEKRDNQTRELSGGMKRRLMIARALMHSPKLLILDEPTAGVDLNLRESTRQFLREINEAGTTIILTTHYLEEVEKLCNTLAFISK
jgi:ABC-2 type transport system ATP-binding protein